MSIPTVSNLKNSNLQAINIPFGNEQQRATSSNLLAGLQPFLQGAIGRLGGMASGDEGAFSALEAPAFRNFDEALGRLSSRFSASGGRRSSGFQNMAAGQAQSLAENLQSQRLNMQNNALSQLFNLSQGLLQTPMQQTALAPQQTPFWKELLTSLAPALAQGATGFGGSAALLKLFPKLMG